MATAIFICMFADHRAVSGDALAPGNTDFRGWAGEKSARTTGLVWGSVLWLLNGFEVVVGKREQTPDRQKLRAISRGIQL